MSRDVLAVQRAMVRMLFDPTYVHAVQTGPVDGLTEPERALLLQVDPRAWSTDRFRRTRGVHALIEEFPTTAALLGVPRMDAFFSSAAFADCLDDKGSMALAFGAWARPETGGIGALELAIARARRRERRTGGPIGTRPGLEPVLVPTNHLALWNQLRERLGADPAQTLAQGWTPVHLPEPHGPPEPLLVERAPDGNIGIGGASPALAALLLYGTTGRSLDALSHRATELGCDATEARELVTDLLTEGLLVAL